MQPSSSFDRFIGCIRSPLFFIIWLVLMVLSYLFIDKGVALYFQPHDFRFYGLYDDLTLLGYPSYFIGLLIILYLIGRFIFSKTAMASAVLLMLTALVSTTIIQTIVKFILGRARPVMLFEHGYFGFGWFQTTNEMWSLPSGLITTDTALLMALCFIFPRYWFGFIILLLILSFSRLVVTVHYISDAMATMYIMAIIVIWIADYMKKRHWLIWANGK